MARKDLSYYLSLPYTIEAIREIGEDEGSQVWFARVVELPGCMTDADSFEELGEMILDAMAAWIEVALEDGDAIPEPRPMGSYSGKFVTRVPRSLHRDLAMRAKREGVSLNAFVNVALARALGHYGVAQAGVVEMPVSMPVGNQGKVARLALRESGDEFQATDPEEK